MDNKAVAIVESPLQAMSLLEFCFLKSIPPSDLTLILNLNTKISGHNKKLIDTVFDFYKFETAELSSYYEYDITESFLQLVFNVGQINDIEKQLQENQFEYMLIGEFRSYIARHLVNKLTVKHCVFLDDGNAIKRAPKMRAEPESIKVKCKNIFLNLLGYDLKVLNKITYFSAFLKKRQFVSTQDRLTKNEFNKLASLQKEAEESDSILGIVGSPLFTAGVCTLENELKSNQILVDYIRELLIVGKKVVYFPHRRESEEKLNYFENCGIEINKQQAPIELKLLIYQNIKLIGFYSSCFETLPLVYPNIEITSLTLPLELVEESWKSFVNTQYETYLGINNITTINRS